MGKSTGWEQTKGREIIIPFGYIRKSLLLHWDSSNTVIVTAEKLIAEQSRAERIYDARHLNYWLGIYIFLCRFIIQTMVKSSPPRLSCLAWESLLHWLDVKLRRRTHETRMSCNI